MGAIDMSPNCKHDAKIMEMDREIGEIKMSHVALVDRMDMLVRVGIAVGIVLLTNTLALLSFLLSFWIKNANG